MTFVFLCALEQKEKCGSARFVKWPSPTMDKQAVVEKVLNILTYVKVQLSEQQVLELKYKYQIKIVLK